MRKQLGIVASLLFLCATAFFWVGCSDNRWGFSQPDCEVPCQPVCQEPCKPVCPPPPCKPVCEPPVCKPVCPPPVCKPVCPPPPCEPLCKLPVKCKHPSTNELCCKDGVTVTARNPNLCMLGDQYPLEFDVKACEDVCDVIVTTHLPDGVTFIRSQPEGRVDGRKVVWHFGAMDKGDCQLAKVWLRCDCEGELCACFCATAVPVKFCALLCAKPVLTCEKCGPEEVCPGDPVHYTITVTNRGSCTAEDVVVTDNVPEGLEHASCLKTLTFKLGNIEPCQSKKVEFCLTAVKRGKVCNTAVVTACNADSVSCQACTCVCCCAIECFKTGPKEQAIGKNADYQITVTNTGDKPLTDVVVADNAPSSTSIVTANGATIRGNQAVWRLKELKAGEKATFNLTLTSCTPGCLTNRVNVTNCQGCNSSCEFMTHWKGHPALSVCVAQTENPICINETTSYNVIVLNQGSEPDSNVSVVVTFPDELQPVSVAGDIPGKISGQTVKFASYPSLGARQTIKYRVDAKGKKSGDARVKVEVSSDAIKTPIVQQESTIVN